jgi:hypothetical protein
MSVCSERNNAWYVTNSASLQGRYDSGNDSLAVVFLTKSNSPSADGSERFNGTLSGASAYFGGTNSLQMRIILGQQKYQLRFADARGQPVPLGTNTGSTVGDHNLGTSLHQCYWLIGAQNTETGRGAVFWDRTFVATSKAPVSAVSGAAQTSTDGQGLVTITNGFFDAEGETGVLRIDASTNGGASWFKPWISDVTGTYAAAAVPGDAMQVIGVSSVNGLEVAVTNLLSVTWNTRHASNAVDLSGGVFTNLRVRIVPDNLSVPGVAVTSAVFTVDNEPPSATGASVTVESGATFTFNTSLNSTWSGFVDAGSEVAGYYYSLGNSGGTTAGTWTVSSSALVASATPDATNTVYVWGSDLFGNIGAAAADSIIVLSSDGDWDLDGMPNGWEVSNSFAPNNLSDAVEDQDSDGYLNRDEYFWGTSPTNNDSHLMFDAERSAGAVCVVRWSGTAGRLYSAYFADGSFSNNMPWSPMPACTNIEGFDGLMVYTDESSIVEGRFYKLGVKFP